jgi:uncharacterized caspase-like protein
MNTRTQGLARPHIGLVLGLLLASLSFQCAAGERRALVIGNARYLHVAPLENPSRDAELVAASLEHVGFKVTLLRDATLQQMAEGAAAFGRGIGRGDIAFLYFAGHGVQYAAENYLIPVDADVTVPEQLRQRAFPLGRLLAALPADGRAASIVVLDACRNNPFAERSPAYARALNPSLSASSAPSALPAGLSQIEQLPGNTLVAFATSPGKVALDGSGRNSPYAEALAEVIRGEGLEVTAVFQEATLRVKRSTGFRQEPWVNWSLNDKVVLKKRKGNNIIF